MHTRLLLLACALVSPTPALSAQSSPDPDPLWAFTPPVPQPVPEVEDASWPRNETDRFVLARLEQTGLSPSPEADRATLIRRVAFDLTGLPPEPAEIGAFMRDRQPGAYERMVDRYLASPHYAEHMGRHWLDLARYADTHGYQYDRERSMWAWRDWVIEAYAQNMPFDRFTVEQLAGDLLPDATLSQRIATGFNRNHPITIEGGVVDEEYRVEYVMDRVNTTSTVWMGLTVACARCHDHKYDPITRKDFYRLFAFFNQVPERGLNGFDPRLTVPLPEALEQAAELDREIQRVEAAARPPARELAEWEARLARAAGWRPLGRLADGALEAAGPIEALTALRIAGDAEPAVRVHPPPGTTPVGRFVRIELTGERRYLSLAEVRVWSSGRDVAEGKAARQSSVAYGGSPERAVDGRTDGVYREGSVTHTSSERDPWWEVDLGRALPVERIEVWNRTDCCGDRLAGHRVVVLDAARAQVFEREVEAPPAPVERHAVGGPRAVPLVRRGDAWVTAAGVSVPAGSVLEVRVDGERASGTVEVSDDETWIDRGALSPDAARALAVPAAERSAADLELLAAFRLSTDPARAGVRARLAELRAERARILEAGKTTVMVMRDAERERPTYVLERGQYDQPREQVSAGVPAALPPLPAGAPHDRLGLARWLTSPEHPLTARVAVNRYWQLLFGRGLVETPEDFGSRGARPSHPRLLDWLAIEFVRSGWDIEAMLRRLVLSATYRQQSRMTPELLAADPENRLLARASRLRLDAECIRDQALALGGLLDRRIGGPSVYPYQPPGLWLEINDRPNLSRPYPEPTPAGAHRRSMYTFWKRTLPPPSMQAFDAPNREACTVRRSRTSTPLQALVLLHDPQFVEAGRALGARILREAAGSDDARIVYGFRLATGRAPDASEREELHGFLRAERRRFAADPALAERALSVGTLPRDPDLPAVDHAAWMSVARLLLNLDEVIHRS